MLWWSFSKQWMSTHDIHYWSQIVLPWWWTSTIFSLQNETVYIFQASQTPSLLKIGHTTFPFSSSIAVPTDEEMCHADRSFQQSQYHLLVSGICFCKNTSWRWNILELQYGLQKPLNPWSEWHGDRVHHLQLSAHWDIFWADGSDDVFVVEKRWN